MALLSISAGGKWNTAFNTNYSATTGQGTWSDPYATNYYTGYSTVTYWDVVTAVGTGYSFSTAYFTSWNTSFLVQTSRFTMNFEDLYETFFDTLYVQNTNAVTSHMTGTAYLSYYVTQYSGVTNWDVVTGNYTQNYYTTNYTTNWNVVTNRQTGNV